MTTKFNDDETGEMVSRRELARRRESRAAERQAPQAAPAEDLHPRAEWDPLLAKRLEREKRPPSGVPAPAIMRSQPEPPSCRMSR